MARGRGIGSLAEEGGGGGERGREGSAAGEEKLEGRDRGVAGSPSERVLAFGRQDIGWLLPGFFLKRGGFGPTLRFRVTPPPPGGSCGTQKNRA